LKASIGPNDNGIGNASVGSVHRYWRSKNQSRQKKKETILLLTMICWNHT